MTSVKEILQSEFDLQTGKRSEVRSMRAMGERWLTDNEAQVREEFPELFEAPVLDDERQAASNALVVYEARITELQGQLTEANDALVTGAEMIATLKGDLQQAGDEVMSLRAQLAARVQAEQDVLAAAQDALLSVAEKKIDPTVAIEQPA